MGCVGMNIIGIGTDIIETERFKQYELPFDEHFCKRVFTEYERGYLIKKNKAAAQSMAGFFAAKEAVAKAIGTGFNGFWPGVVEIQHDPMGKPLTVLHGGAQEAAQQAGIARIDVSISHCDHYAVAFAVAIG